MMDELEQWLDDDYPRAYRTAWLLTNDTAAASEAVRHAYLRVWRSRHSLPSGDGRRPWLYRALVGACATVDLSDRRDDHTAVDDEIGHRVSGGQLMSTDPRPVDGAPQVAVAVVEAMAKLAPEVRCAVVLRHWTGLSAAEIATATRSRRRVVAQRLDRGRRHLSEDLNLLTPLAQEA